MRRLTLDQTWSRCLAMWRWIVEECRKPNPQSIDALKLEWIVVHDADSDVQFGCYFCEWNLDHNHRYAPECCGCPGALVSKSFRCWNMSYHYIAKPAAFLRKLEQLNAKRLAQKKAKKSKR